jgi:hypothetical protein
MTTLRTSVQDYVTMRRGLEFELRDAGIGLVNFVSFMESKRASHITTDLALEWAQKPKTVLPLEWAETIELGARLCTLSERKRSPDPDSTEGAVAVSLSAAPALYLHRPRNRAPACSRSSIAPSGRTTRLEISLLVWTSERLRSAHQ